MPIPEHHQPDIAIPAPSIAQKELDAIVRHHVWMAMGVGLIPFPVIDLLAISGVQLNLLRKIAGAYHIPFSNDVVKNLLAALIGSTLPATFAPGVAASLIKVIPLFGEAVGVVTLPALAGASTYAVGKVFNRHFASGGTFLTFNPEKVRDFYAEMFAEGQQIVAAMKKK